VAVRWGRVCFSKADSRYRAEAPSLNRPLEGPMKILVAVAVMLTLAGCGAAGPTSIKTTSSTTAPQVHHCENLTTPDPHNLQAILCPGP
jgi:predicted small lipoprotein YifL